MNKAITPTELRQQLTQLRTKLDRALTGTKTHFGMHLVYMVAYDDLEELTRKAAKALTEQEDDHK